MISHNTSKFARTGICICILISLAFSIVSAEYATNFLTASAEQKKQVTLRALLTDLSDAKRWQSLFAPAMQELRARHPDIDIQINYSTYPYNQTRSHIMKALSNNTAIDLISLDQIWLSDFAQKGLLTDLSNYVINGEGSQIGTELILMVVCIKVRYMAYGHGLTLEESGIGRIY